MTQRDKSGKGSHHPTEGVVEYALLHQVDGLLFHLILRLIMKFE